MFGNMLGNCLFQELGTHSSKIGKHWFEPLGASSSLNWEPAVPRLQQFPELGTRCFKIARIVLSYRFGLNGPDGPNGLQRAPTGLLHGLNGPDGPNGPNGLNGLDGLERPWR